MTENAKVNGMTRKCVPFARSISVSNTFLTNENGRNGADASSRKKKQKMHFSPETDRVRDRAIKKDRPIFIGFRIIQAIGNVGHSNERTEKSTKFTELLRVAERAHTHRMQSKRKPTSLEITIRRK